MKTLRYGWLLLCLVAAAGGSALGQTKMVIATGVDPVFSTWYVAQEAGLFKKHGLDVQINTGPSGSAMISLLVGGQIQAASGSEIAGVNNHNLDPNVVVVAQETTLVRWISLLARNVATLEAFKGKKVGIARGTGGELFWLAMIDKLKLNAADYTVVNVEAPEMVAALERNDIDGFAVWEPWITRGLQAIPNTKVLRTQEGILEQAIHTYMNREWIQKNQIAAEQFVRALVEASDLINRDRKQAAQMVSNFLKNLDPPLVETLMGKLRYDVRLDQASIDFLKTAEAKIKAQGKLIKPVDYPSFIYPDLLKRVRPEKVNYKL